MQMIMVNACFSAWSLPAEVIASFLDPAKLFFSPDTIRSNQFSRRRERFKPDQHINIVRDLPSIEALRIESKDGHGGPYFELMTIGTWNFQELVWRIPYGDLDFWQIYSSVSNLPGFNALLAADPEDVQWQSEESISAFEIAGIDHTEMAKIEDLSFGGTKIDILKNPGRRTMYPGFWLQAPWQVCYSGAALSILGKQRILSLPDMVENRQIKDRDVYVRLFEDPFSAASDDNRMTQQRFRDWLGLNILEETAISHASAQADPVVEIEEGRYSHGGVRLVRKWVNGQGRIIRRSKAVGCEEIELDPQGKVVWIIDRRLQ